MYQRKQIHASFSRGIINIYLFVFVNWASFLLKIQNGLIECSDFYGSHWLKAGRRHSTPLIKHAHMDIIPFVSHNYEPNFFLAFKIGPWNVRIYVCKWELYRFIFVPESCKKAVDACYYTGVNGYNSSFLKILLISTKYLFKMQNGQNNIVL